MEGDKGKRRLKTRKLKDIDGKLIATTVAIAVLSILLYQSASSLTGMLFSDRFDEKQVIALNYSAHLISFEKESTISNVTGESVLLLNITLPTKTSVNLYSDNFTSDDVEAIGILEKDGKEFLLIFPSAVEDGEKYVIWGKFINLYNLGTKEQSSVLYVENYHKPGLLEEFVSANRFFLSQAAILLVVATTACVLAELGMIILIVNKVFEKKS